MLKMPYAEKDISSSRGVWMGELMPGCWSGLERLVWQRSGDLPVFIVVTQTQTNSWRPATTSFRIVDSLDQDVDRK